MGTPCTSPSDRRPSTGPPAPRWIFIIYIGFSSVVATAAAAVEDKQRFNFGHAAKTKYHPNSHPGTLIHPKLPRDWIDYYIDLSSSFRAKLEIEQWFFFLPSPKCLAHFCLDYLHILNNSTYSQYNLTLYFISFRLIFKLNQHVISLDWAYTNTH